MLVGIYKITNKINGEFYIGSSINIIKRKRKHKFHLDKGDHSNQHLQRAWIKYGGVNNFRFDIIIECSEGELVEREQYYIDLLNPEYNICRTAYSTLNRKATDETKRKMSLVQKGKKRSAEFSETMSRVRKGTTMSEQQRKDVSKALSVKVIKCDWKGNEIEEYNSIKEAALKNKCHASAITNVCNSKPLKTKVGNITYRVTAGGFKWKYKSPVQYAG